MLAIRRANFQHITVDDHLRWVEVRHINTIYM